MAIGGSAAPMQLAQLGYSVRSDAAKCDGITSAAPFVGFSKELVDTDVVIIGLLANDWTYNREIIEPVVKSLRRVGVEVILVTDNQRAVTAGMTYNQYITADPLFNDARWVTEVADKYGCALADTAAYVANAYFRWPSVTYLDQIHMQKSAAVSGPSVDVVTSGAEVWARAVRSIFAMDMAWANTPFGSYDFTSTKAPWATYNSPTSCAISGGYLVVVPVGVNDGCWLASLGNLAGDVINVSFEIIFDVVNASAKVFLYNNGWTSLGGGVQHMITSSGSYSLQLPADFTNCHLMFSSNGGSGTVGQWRITNVVVSVDKVTATVPLWADFKAQSLPQESRITSLLKIPGGAQLTLPDQEYNYANATGVAGTVSQTPLNSYSFARRHKGLATLTNDLLTLAPTKEALIGSWGMVGLAVIRPGLAPVATVEIRRGATLLKTVSLGAAGVLPAIQNDLITPDEYAQTLTAPAYDALRVIVTSGSLQAQAFVAFTSELEYLRPDQLGLSGTFAKNTAISGLSGMKSSVAGDTVSVSFPYPVRVQFIVSSDDAGTVDVFTESTISTGQAIGASSIVASLGGSRPLRHSIRLATNSMVVGGAVVIQDR